MQEMPSRGKHITMFVFTWIFFTICGFFSIGAFVTMNKAINAGDVEQANLSANKVRKVFWISLILCIVFVVLYIILISSGLIALNAAYSVR